MFKELTFGSLWSRTTRFSFYFQVGVWFYNAKACPLKSFFKRFLQELFCNNSVMGSPSDSTVVNVFLHCYKEGRLTLKVYETYLDDILLKVPSKLGKIVKYTTKYTLYIWNRTEYFLFVLGGVPWKLPERFKRRHCKDLSSERRSLVTAMEFEPTTA